MGEGIWELTDHLCRVCLGRVLARRDASGRQVVRCAECETEAIGSVRALCACGARLRSGRSAGLACRRNPSPTPEAPGRVVVVYVGEVSDVEAALVAQNVDVMTRR